MSEPLKIGVTNLDGMGGNRKEHFSIKANEDNLYRPLPPLFSLAERGQFAKYWASHSVFLVAQGSDGKPKWDVYNFQCLEKVNKETKLITQHCPFCDTFRENQARHSSAKAQGVSKENLEEFFNKNVRPYQTEKRFYINAVNQENRVGVLTIPIKAFDGLQQRLKEAQAKYQIDATGTNGLFLNFKKTQKFKGDRDTAYSVDFAMDMTNVNGVPQMQLKQHVLTKDFLTVIEKGARDLSTIMRLITPEDMSSIITADITNKKALMDRIFGRGEKTQAQSTYNIGGTNAEAVTRVDMVAGEVKLTSPQPIVSAPSVNVSVAPATAPILAQTPMGAQSPVVAQATNPFQGSAPAQFPVSPTSSTSGAANMSDEDFMKLFGSK
jgi:hypothetical protein